MAIDIPEKVISIPAKCLKASVSRIIIKPNRAVIGGTSVMISIEKRDPMIVYDLNRKRSPKTKPTSPERVSHNQFAPDASTGRRAFLLTRVKRLRNVKPITRRIMLREREPIRLAADSNDNAVMVQKTAVRRDANSPR